MVTAQRAIQARLAIVNGFDLKALWLQILRHQRAELYVIINDQNAIHNFIVAVAFRRPGKDSSNHPKCAFTKIYSD